MAFKFAVIYSAVFIAVVSAANDWSKPCFDGECQYDIPSTDVGSSGTLKIWGPKDLINDITPAGGWTIIDCDPDKLVQDIRLVCADGSAEDCAKLTVGSVGRIVRLPESCGGLPFAVVKGGEVADDQSIPSHLLPRFMRRDGARAMVQALSLGDDFSSVELPEGSEPVKFVVQGANYEDGAIELEKPSDDQDGSPLQRRGGIKPKKWVKDANKALKKENEWNIDKKKDLKNIKIEKPLNVFEKSISCPPVNAGSRMDFNAKFNAVVSLAVVAHGTITPPEIKDFSMVVTVDADISGDIDLKASVGGKIESGKVPLLDKMDIPGLKLDNILKIGPTFEIYAKAEAGLDIAADMRVGVNYKIGKATFTFPPDDDEKSGSFEIGDTPLTLSAHPSATVNGKITAHIVPRFNFGIDALLSNIKANVFLNLDARATTTLNIEAVADASATHQRRSLYPPAGFLRSRLASRAPQDSDTTGLVESPVPMNPALPISSTQTSDISDGIVDPSIIARSPQDGGAKSGWTTSTTPLTTGGCFEVDVGFDVHAGTEGKFLHFFDADTETKLFEKHWSLVKKCFGSKDSGSKARRSLSEPANLESRNIGFSRLRIRDIGDLFDLKCDSASSDAKQTITDQTIQAATVARREISNAPYQ